MLKEDQAEADVRHHKIKEGFLIKRSRILKEWKKRWMVLTRTHLYSYETKGIYRNPTEKIPLKEVSTVKSYYKNQYERPYIIRIESDDTYFYLSAQDHQDKWAWMTAVEKMTDQIRNPSTQDSQNMIRETLRMSTALRQSSMMFTPKKINHEESSGDILKHFRLAVVSNVVEEHYQPSKKKNPQLSINRVSAFTWPGTGVKSEKQPTESYVERIVERIVEVRVPVEVERIVER